MKDSKGLLAGADSEMKADMYRDGKTGIETLIDLEAQLELVEQDEARTDIKSKIASIIDRK